MCEWRPIPAMPEYEASAEGHVRSLVRGRGGYVLTESCSPNGYLYVGTKYGRKSVHSLVCSAFNGPKPSEKHEVAHGNGTRTDNRPANLRWATRSENNRDQDLHGTRVRKFGVENHQTPFTNDDVKMIVEMAKAGVGPTAIARRYGVQHNAIRQITTGKSWSHLTGIGRS